MEQAIRVKAVQLKGFLQFLGSPAAASHPVAGSRSLLPRHGRELERVEMGHGPWHPEGSPSNVTDM